MSTAKKILIIDDDPDALTYLSTVLQDHHYETITASDGDEGLKKLQEIVPDLILLDLMMPKKSGVKFLNEIKLNEALKHIPIIVESGASNVTGVDMKNYIENNPFRDRKDRILGTHIDTTPQAYIEKPIDPKELIDTVKKFI
jgi:two-component system phosphate regulon response regulator PhoB